MKVENKLLENGRVERTTTEEMERYSVRARYVDESDFMLEDLKSNYKIWIGNNREGFNCMETGEDWEPEKECISKDLASFQEYLDREYGKGKFESFAIGAYIHSGVSFSISKSDDNRCEFDSGTIGFIGIPREFKDWATSNLANYMTSAWNNEFVLYEVIDELNGEIVDELTTASYRELKEFNELCMEKYGVNFDKVKIQY